MKNKKRISMIFLFLILGSDGCANLAVIRDYAAESAKLSAYTELTTRFRDTYKREGPYLYGDAAKLAEANDNLRKSAYADLIEIHGCVMVYMQTLAKLAGKDTFDLTPNIDALKGGIKSYPDFGLEDKHVEAVSNISKVVARWVTASSQKHAVQQMVEEGDADLQTILEGLKALVLFYKKTSENERKTVLNLIEAEMALSDVSKDRLLLTLAREHLQTKEIEFDRVAEKFKAAEQGIEEVSKGHTRIRQNINHLCKDDIMAMISQISQKIKMIRKSLMVNRTE